MRILVVEDEPRMLELLRKGLHEHGFAVMTAADGSTGLEVATTQSFSSIVLDIGLPYLDGYGVMQALRMRGNATPVIMLTARDAEDDIIRGLDLGADDYLTKPFPFAELVARLRSITRYRHAAREVTIEAGGVRIDVTRHSVTYNMQPIDLTRHEYLLLLCLMRSAGRHVQRQTIMKCVWGSDAMVRASTLDVLVSSLRAKLEGKSVGEHLGKLIGTVRGAGYFIRSTPWEQGA
jgi:DNA-binding response OmpR family regulator